MLLAILWEGDPAVTAVGWCCHRLGARADSSKSTAGNLPRAELAAEAVGLVEVGECPHLGDEMVLDDVAEVPRRV
eukprot:7164484-Pyramimonas_sp.AAC.1